LTIQPSLAQPSTWEPASGERERGGLPTVINVSFYFRSAFGHLIGGNVVTFLVEIEM